MSRSRLASGQEQELGGQPGLESRSDFSVALSKSVHLSEPQFYHLYVGDTDRILQDLKKEMGHLGGSVG